MADLGKDNQDPTWLVLAWGEFKDSDRNWEAGREKGEASPQGCPETFREKPG